MKLYLIIPSLGAGGAERVGVLLANGFVKRGHEVVVFSNLLHSKDYQLDKSISIVDIAKEGEGRIGKWWHAICVVRKKVKNNPPNFFIGIMGVFSLVAYIACIGLHVPVIATMHNSFERPSYKPMSLLEQFLKYDVNRIFKKVTLLTNSDRLVVGKQLNNAVVMPNPLALSPVEEIKSRENIILAAGRLDDWHYKGFDILIRAWALVNGQLIIDNGKLSSNGETWKLQIAGTGSEKSLNYLKQLCRENGVEDSVEFLGFRKDVEKLYQEASIFVLSSRYEGFGLVLIEAMSQGCACVACDYNGRQREILSSEGQGSKFNVHGSNNLIEACENGILCEPDDVESLAAGIQKMMADDEYRENVRAKAIERSKFYSIENTVDRWELLLNQITKE